MMLWIASTRTPAHTFLVTLINGHGKIYRIFYAQCIFIKKRELKVGKPALFLDW